MRLQTMLWTTVLCGLGTMVTLSATAVRSQSANDLQTTAPQRPLELFNQEDPNDPANLFSDRANGSSVLNLINRIQLLNGKSPQQHAEDLDENLNDAAADFRKKQLQQIEQQPTGSPTTN